MCFKSKHPCYINIFQIIKSSENSKYSQWTITQKRKPENSLFLPIHFSSNDFSFIPHKHPSHRLASPPHRDELPLLRPHPPPPFHFAASASFLQLVVRKPDRKCLRMNSNVRPFASVIPASFPSLEGWIVFKPSAVQRNLRSGGHEAWIPRWGKKPLSAPYFHKTTSTRPCLRLIVPSPPRDGSIHDNETRAISARVGGPSFSPAFKLNWIWIRGMSIIEQ